MAAGHPGSCMPRRRVARPRGSHSCAGPTGNARIRPPGIRSKFAGSLPTTVEALELPTIFDGASDVLGVMMDAGIAHHYREDFRPRGR